MAVSPNRTNQAGVAEAGDQADRDERLRSATSGTAPRTWLTVTDRGAAVLDAAISDPESRRR